MNMREATAEEEQRLLRGEDKRTVHASQIPETKEPLCSMDGGGCASLEMVVDVTHPEAGELMHLINCKSCAEWMHA